MVAKAVSLTLVILLSGCTLDLRDRRIDPVAVQAAFKERDAALVEMAKIISQLKEKLEKLAPKETSKAEVKK